MIQNVIWNMIIQHINWLAEDIQKWVTNCPKRREEVDIPLSQKFYFPFRDCSALLLKDIVPDESGSSSGAAAAIAIKESECPKCRRLFHAQCGVPWHAGLDCSEFQKLSDFEKEKCDLMLFMLAKYSEWQWCASCKHIIEISFGCSHMICRSVNW